MTEVNWELPTPKINWEQSRMQPAVQDASPGAAPCIWQCDQGRDTKQNQHECNHIYAELWRLMLSVAQKHSHAALPGP